MWDKVLDKIKKYVLSDIGLKIVALLAAMILWLVVVNIEDPSRTKFFTAKVQVINDSVLTDSGKYYEIPDSEAAVTFRVTAKRSIIEKLSNGDFKAVADLNYMGSDNKVPVDIEATRFTNQVTISSRSFYVNLSVGSIQKKRFSVKAVTKGEPASGVVVTDAVAEPNVITISGPDKIVSTIKSVQAVCDVTGIQKDITDTVVPVLLNSKGKEIDPSKLTISSETVEVSVTTGSVKEVKINAETSGKLPDGITLSSVTVTPEKVALQGEADNLNSVSQITIPSTVINLDNVTKDTEFTVDISSYLPDGVELKNLDDKTVKVKVKVASATTRNFSIPTANLTIGGLPQGYECNFVSNQFDAAIKGLPANLDKLDASKITGRVDASGLGRGTHHVTVVLNLGEEYTVETISIEVKITDKSN